MNLDMKKFLIVAMAAIAALCFIMPAQAKTNKEGSPSIRFLSKDYNFGVIQESKGPVSCEFEFVNDGDANLVIIDATAECGCTRPEFPKKPIAPGKKGKIKVTYNPAARPGSFNKKVTVRTNGNPSKSYLKIKGNVTR